jgi:hypothetical protein
MAVKMYKNGNSIKVRGCNVQAQLDAGWTFESANKSTPRSRQRIKVKDVDVIKSDLLEGPEDLTNEEQENGN